MFSTRSAANAPAAEHERLEHERLEHEGEKTEGDEAGKPSEGGESAARREAVNVGRERRRRPAVGGEEPIDDDRHKGDHHHRRHGETESDREHVRVVAGDVGAHPTESRVRHVVMVCDGCISVTVHTHKCAPPQDSLLPLPDDLPPTHTDM